MKKGKVRMKRKLSILLAVGLIAGSLALPSYAATAETVQEVQTHSDPVRRNSGGDGPDGTGIRRSIPKRRVRKRRRLTGMREV